MIFEGFLLNFLTLGEMFFYEKRQKQKKLLANHIRGSARIYIIPE
jgi:hypothetical protein